MGFSDGYIGKWWGMSESEVYALRRANGILPVYKMIDTCASEFDSYIPYFYSTYEEENESVVTDKPSVVVLGAGPIRIGQGVEFDYSTVHAIWAIREAGYEAIIINNNPETVSTDYTVSDKLYFEPLTVEDVMNIIDMERPYGRHRVAGRADRHQSGGPAFAAGRAHHRHGRGGHRARGEPRQLRKDHAPPEYPPAGGLRGDEDRGWRRRRRSHRLSGAGAPFLCAGRPRHADRV